MKRLNCRLILRPKRISLLLNGPQGTGVVAEPGIDAKVPDGLTYVGWGDDFDQGVLADKQGLGGCYFEPVLAGENLHLGRDDVFVLRHARTIAKPDWGECAPCLRLATSLALPVLTVVAWETTCSAPLRSSSAR